MPEEMALAGFDDIPIARFITPPLTTVRVSIAELGSTATARLVHALDGSDGREGKQEILATALVVRASCGAQLKTGQHASEIEERRLRNVRKKEGMR
jgi:LacI family transcriptional regulator